MTQGCDEASATADAEALAALIRALRAVTPAIPERAPAASAWVERRRDHFDTLDPYGDGG